MDLPADLSQRISSAAQNLAAARRELERARTWEERKLAQIAFDQAEQEMVNQSMNVNRGLSRVAPEA